MLAALLLSTLAAAPAQDLDRALTALVQDLHLADVPGFDASSDLGVAVDLSAANDGDRLAPVVSGLVRRRLDQLGLGNVLPLDAVDDEQARLAGAEWLLVIHGERRATQLRLFATLRQIDAGLWKRPPVGAIAAIAEHTIDPPAAPPPAPPPPAPTTAPTLQGPPVVLTVVPGRVVAMGACRLDGEDERLVVLTEHALEIFALTASGVSRLASLDLRAFPRARSPSREPFGAITCGNAKVAFGSSDLATGHVARWSAGALSHAATLAGIPVARYEGRWLLARPNPGTSWYAAQKLYDDVEIPEAYALARTDERMLLVTRTYELRDHDKKIADAGAALATFDGSALFTAPRLEDGSDIVSMYSSEYPLSTIRIPAPVQVITAGRMRQRSEVVTASWRPEGGSELRVFTIRGSAP